MKNKKKFIILKEHFEYDSWNISKKVGDMVWIIVEGIESIDEVQNDFLNFNKTYHDGIREHNDRLALIISEHELKIAKCKKFAAKYMKMQDKHYNVVRRHYKNLDSFMNKVVNYHGHDIALKEFNDISNYRIYELEEFIKRYEK